MVRKMVGTKITDLHANWHTVQDQIQGLRVQIPYVRTPNMTKYSRNAAQRSEAPCQIWSIWGPDPGPRDLRWGPRPVRDDPIHLYAYPKTRPRWGPRPDPGPDPEAERSDPEVPEVIWTPHRAQIPFIQAKSGLRMGPNRVPKSPNPFYTG